MDAMGRSKKRKCPSARDPFAGIFTRSRSRIFLHSNRSGRYRTDPTHPTHQPRLAKEEPADAIEIGPLSSVKDLRTRRIFSPSSPFVSESSPAKDHAIGELPEPIKPFEDCETVRWETRVRHSVDDGNLDSKQFHKKGETYVKIEAISDVTQPQKCQEIENLGETIDPQFQKRSELDPEIEVENNDESQTGLRDNGQILNQINQPLTGTDGEILKGSRDSIEEKCVGGSLSEELKKVEEGETPSLADCCKEDFTQSTPPNDVFDKPQVGGDGKAWQNLSKGSTQRNGVGLNDGTPPIFGTARKCISKRKMVLNPCSRVKVFKTPSSYSYKRLLPYLMDITNDSSCAAKNYQRSKLEKGSEPKQFTSSKVSQCEEKSDGKATANENFAVELQMNNSGSLRQPNFHVTKLSPGLQKNVESLIQDQEPMPDHSDNFKTQREHESPIQLMDLPVMASLSSSGALEASPREENDGKCMTHPSHSLVEGPSLISSSEKKQTVALDLNSSKVASDIDSGDGSPDFSKPVLKRNPRGCRGLCSCLTCASFRLHAERAFEFSRNQMHDAEEVALELIKELSYLRNMLEKSACSANELGTLCYNEVKEACRKAFAVEELARTRVTQMNDDLNHHCRVKQPRVNFADHAEDKVIPNCKPPKGP